MEIVFQIIRYHLFNMVTKWITTGNRNFAECHMLCRVLKLGHSAKSFFAECRTRQSKALGKELFVECLMLDTVRHSAKMPFAECQTLGKPLHSAKRDGDTHREPLPSATRRHSAKIFLFFIFYLPPNFFCGLYTLFQSVC